MWSDQGSQLCVYCVCPIAVTVLQLARLQPGQSVTDNFVLPLLQSSYQYGSNYLVEHPQYLCCGGVKADSS